jgi:hypothetical protein
MNEHDRGAAHGVGLVDLLGASQMNRLRLGLGLCGHDVLLLPDPSWVRVVRGQRGPWPTPGRKPAMPCGNSCGRRSPLRGVGVDPRCRPRRGCALSCPIASASCSPLPPTAGSASSMRRRSSPCRASSRRHGGVGVAMGVPDPPGHEDLILDGRASAGSGLSRHRGLGLRGDLTPVRLARHPPEEGQSVSLPSRGVAVFRD